VSGDAKAGGTVERADGDVDALTVSWSPEEARAALGTKAATRMAIAPGALHPAQGTFVEQRETLRRRRRERAEVTAPAVALLAVAENDVP
jgi:hypothetical protein